MIAPSLHPAPVRAVCERQRKLAFGLTARSIGLLTAGFLLLVPGFYVARLSYAMLVWDGLILLAALLDGLRLPAARLLTAERSWSNAPALDSETEIELSLENKGRVVLECRLVDDLPSALAAEPVKQKMRVFPRVPARIRFRVTPRERGDVQTGSLYVRYRSPLGLAERWARAAAHADCRASTPPCAPARNSRYFWPAAARSTCSSASRASADWAATSKACANTAKGMICAISAGPPPHAAATW